MDEEEEFCVDLAIALDNSQYQLGPFSDAWYHDGKITTWHRPGGLGINKSRKVTFRVTEIEIEIEIEIEET